MNDFNAAFVGLMGAADIGPIQGKPAGRTAQEMEQFRQFALRIRFPPNPNRLVDDTLPAANVPVRGTPFSGNPAAGLVVFDSASTDAGEPCRACHSHPFGAAGGQLGGVTPTSPTSPAAAGMFHGVADQNNHNDMGVPHLRNLYEKIGPQFGDHVGAPPLARSGLGFIHDGSIPDLGTFLSNRVFTMTAQQVRDVSAFMTHFPTGTRPAVGRQLTLPPGAPPTGAPADETLLGVLLGLGDLSNPGRHCELVARTRLGGVARRFRWSSGSWVSDVGSDPPRTTLGLRTAATAPLTFLCVPLDSGLRLGGDRDEDAVLDGDDCNAADPGAWSAPAEVGGLLLSKSPGTQLTWGDGSAAAGPGLRYEVLGGSLSTLRTSGLAAATGCVASDLATPGWPDPAPDPAPSAGRFWIVRARNSCALGSAGPGRGVLDALVCPTVPLP